MARVRDLTPSSGSATVLLTCRVGAGEQGRGRVDEPRGRFRRPDLSIAVREVDAVYRLAASEPRGFALAEPQACLDPLGPRLRHQGLGSGC